jgi:hypothetical protein
LGVRLSADSSKKTRQALRRWAFAESAASARRPSGRWRPGHARRRGAWGAAPSSPAGSEAAPTPRQDGGAPRSAARSPARRGSRVQSPPTNPLAVAPLSSACSTWRSCASDSRGEGPLGPRLRSASGPPACQRACQTLTAWAETPSRRATWAWRTPTANSSAARSRGPQAAGVVVVPQGGEGQSAWPDPYPPSGPAPTRPQRSSTRYPRPFRSAVLDAGRVSQAGISESTASVCIPPCRWHRSRRMLLPGLPCGLRGIE